MTYEVVTLDRATLVPLATLKQFLRIEGEDQNAFLTLILEAVVDEIERRLWRAIYPQTRRRKFTRHVNYRARVVLDVHEPFSSVTVNRTRGGSLVEVPSSDYKTEPNDGLIYSNNGFGVIDSDVAYPFQVDYVCGFSEATLPRAILLAIMQSVMGTIARRGGNVTSRKIGRVTTQYDLTIHMGNADVYSLRRGVIA